MALALLELPHRPKIKRKQSAN